MTILSDVTAPRLLTPRYEMQSELGRGGMGIVYRALDRLTGQAVALKRVVAPTERLTFASQTDATDLHLALAQEFRSLASLRHPNIISVLDYGFDEQRQPFFTMELIERGQSIIDFGRSLPLMEKANLLVQLLQALSYLHRRGIIHRDLKPGNVYVTEYQVKVLDFGLAVAAASQEPKEGSTTSGTIAYMAPELLGGASASVASDLYAAGIIAYELLVGHHPFESPTISGLIASILSKAPDFSGAGLDSRLIVILERLLGKQPDMRYANCRDAIQAVCNAVGLRVPLETSVARESFLRTARLTGREAELEQLSTQLAQMIETRQGGACLVAGESGVGKSRLLDEVRIQALVRGVTVVRGQAVSDGSTPYQLWQNAVHRLLLLGDLTPFEIGVLKPLVPGIEGLDVPPVPELDPKATQSRLLAVVQSALRRRQQPTVIMLEDLHWAGPESLALLASLLELAQQIPLFIIGSYRSDERPDLLANLPGFPVLELKPLTEAQIGELTSSLLGESSRTAEIPQLLDSEIRGNAFFLLEVVRTLAEEAGNIDDIAHATLPPELLRGGIQRLIHRRLDRVPREARPLLEAAAIAGRQLDLDMLRNIDEAFDLNQWLTLCSDAAILDVQEGHWRFTHDKLRQGVLDELDESRQKALHKQVALALETVYPNAPSQAAALAYHWAVVGDKPKELQYVSQAADQTLRNGAYGESLRFLSRALELDKQMRPNPSPTDTLRWVRWERQMSEACLSLGKLAECREHAQQALRALGRPEPTSSVGYIRTLLQQVLIQARHRLTPRRYAQPFDPSKEIIQEGALAYETLGILYYFLQKIVPSIAAPLYGLNLAEEAGISPVMARSYGGMCVITGLVSMHPLAQSYARRAQQIAKQVQDPRTTGVVLSRLLLYDLQTGYWTNDPEFLKNVIDIPLQIGDYRQYRESLAIRGVQNSLHGDYDSCVRELKDVYASARRAGDIQHEAWGLFFRAMAWIRLGNLDEAEPLLEESVEILQRNPNVADRGWEIIAHGLLAMTYLYKGKNDQAFKMARVCSDFIQASSFANWPAALDAYMGAAEVYLMLWESGDPSMEKHARQALAHLKKYTGVFPIGKARTALVRGWIDWLTGRKDKARAAWKSALSEAAKRQMPYDEALIYYQMARLLDKSDPARPEALRKAREIFTRTNAAFDLKRIDALEKA